MYIANGSAILAEMRGDAFEIDGQALGSITMPVLILAAAESPPAFQQMTAAIIAALPHARSALVSGGHEIAPDEQAILRFINERPAAT